MIKNRAKVVPNMSVLGSVWHDLGTILGHTNRPSGGPKVQTTTNGNPVLPSLLVLKAYRQVRPIIFWDLHY